jgi:hypothetical protein
VHLCVPVRTELVLAAALHTVSLSWLAAAPAWVGARSCFCFCSTTQ